MAQVTETVARGILAGHGYTDNEVRQLAHHWLATHGQAPAGAAPAPVLHLVHSAFAEVAMAFPKAFALHKVGIADTAVREALAAPATQQAGEVSESIEQLAVARYKVVPAHESMFHRWAVVAGDGAQQLYIGREVECENMTRKFAGAFLDGAFLALQNATPQPSPTAQAAESVLEDAARYRWLRDEAHPDGVVNDDIHVHVDSLHYPNRWALIGPELDAAVDAARAAQKEGEKP